MLHECLHVSVCHQRASAEARMQHAQVEHARQGHDYLPHAQGERALFKRAKGAFYDTDLEPWLRGRGVTHLLIAGVTTEVRVPLSWCCTLRRCCTSTGSSPGCHGRRPIGQHRSGCSVMLAQVIHL